MNKNKICINGFVDNNKVMDIFNIVPSYNIPFVPVYENDVDVFIPELWSAEALNILSENMISSALVHRDFENVLANYGDTVNVPKPGEFTAIRKTDADPVTIQDATSTSMQVKLNQHVHVSFMIKDGQDSKSFYDLVNIYLKNAIVAQARYLDIMVLSQYVNFLGNVAGGGLTTSNTKDAFLKLRQIMNVNKVPVDGRNLILNPSTETTFLGVTDFTLSSSIEGDKVSRALREAELGRLLGYNLWMDQNMPIVATGSTSASDTVNGALTAGGTSAVLTTGTSTNLDAGAYLTFAGDMVPHRITTWTSGTKTAIFTPALVSNVANGAAVLIYTPGAVNQSVSPTGYAAGYAKAITVDAFTVAPKVGQLVHFDGDDHYYAVIGTPTTTSILLDRPLDAAITDDQLIFLGPPGSFNLAFHQNAIALVVRPLALPRPGLARAAVINYNGLSMRTVITYNGEKQGHLVTTDMLCGITTLDANLGAVLVG